ncbi:hypothetical protein [Variovorax paradoxus]|uniref:hypothetical protein n=1 Tax=Variovorax paradoxus TaxID=34073 RepID=UPI0030D6208C
MLLREYALEYVAQVLGGGAERGIAKEVIRFLEEKPNTKHITIQLVRQLTPGAERGELDRAIIKTLQVLAGEHLRLLDTRFELFDSENVPHDLTDDELSAAIELGINPLTGHEEVDIRSKILMYFAPEEGTNERLQGAVID